MYDKNGNEYLFGASSQSQQSATTTPSNVYKWMLEKEIDTNGNYTGATSVLRGLVFGRLAGRHAVDHCAPRSRS